MQLVQEWMRPARGNFICPLRIGSDTIPPMGLWLRIALLLPLAALIGCASNNSSGTGNSSGSSGTSPLTYNLSGDWAAYTPTPLGGPGSSFSGPLQFSNGSISGTISASPYIPGVACLANPPVTVSATGTIDSSGNLTLNLPLGGSYGTVVITATIPANPQTLVNGSYQITGGSCAAPAAPITIAQYAPLTGTYTGTFSGTGGTETLTAVLTQSATFNGGDFRLTGTITATGTCNANFTIADGFIYVGGGFYASGGGSTSFALTGSVNPSASTITGYFGGCGQIAGTLTKQ